MVSAALQVLLDMCLFNKERAQAEAGLRAASFLVLLMATSIFPSALTSTPTVFGLARPENLKLFFWVRLLGSEVKVTPLRLTRNEDWSLRISHCKSADISQI